MAQELVYTSVPRGLKLGTSGFCTVACTRGMAPNYIETLESLSGYTPVFAPNHPQADDNPLVFSHYRFNIGGRPVSVLSRVAAAGVDYTKRPNKFAHHLVLDVRERSEGGPAWVMRRPGVFLEQWEGDARFLDQPRRIPGGDSPPATCATWEQQLGDAGWAGVLAQAFLEDPARPSFIVFKPGMPVLTLMDEALRLLPVGRRWDVTFNTYFMTLPARATCAWRCCLAGSRVLKQARRMPDALVLDLDAGNEQPVIARRRLERGSPFIAYARTGTPPAVPRRQETPERDERETPVELVDEGVTADRANGVHPRSPAAVWLESVPRGETTPKSNRGRKITLYAFMTVLVCSLLANALLILKPKKNENKSLQSQVVTLTEEKEELASQNTSLQSKFDGLTEEKNSQEKNLEATICKLREDISSLKGQLKAKKTKPAPKFFVRIPQGPLGLPAKMHGADDTLSQYDIPDLPITAEWQVEAIGRWGDGKQIEDVTTEERADNAIKLMGTNKGTDDPMWVVRIEALKNKVRFTRNPHARNDQVKNCLSKFTWLELSKDKERIIIVLSKLTGNIVPAEQGPDDTSPYQYKGSVLGPQFLTNLAKIGTWKWPKDNIDDKEVEWDDPTFAKSGNLTFSVKFSSDDRNIRLEAFKYPLQLTYDGQVVASFDLVLDKN